jgi:hypothetical protein
MKLLVVRVVVVLLGVSPQKALDVAEPGVQKDQELRQFALICVLKGIFA